MWTVIGRMAKAFGRLPHELLALPYGDFLQDLIVYQDMQRGKEPIFAKLADKRTDRQATLLAAILEEI